MDVYNSIAPPYASTVIIDLIQVETGAYIVQLFYRNDSTHDPYPLIIPGNKVVEYLNCIQFYLLVCYIDTLR